MTTMVLTTTVIAPVSDLTDTLLIDQSSEVEDWIAPNEVRRYAGGRRRIVSKPGRDRRVQFSYPALSRANYDSLLDLVGATVLLRDQRSRRIYGVIQAVTGNEFGPSNLVLDASFTITEITYAEEV